jgi:hypothetical protein
MCRQNRTVWLLLVAAGLTLLAALLCGCGGEDAKGAPRANPNRVWLVDAACQPGAAVDLEVWLHNAEPVQVIEIPVRMNATCCTVTSVELMAPFTQHLGMLTWLDADPETQRVDTIVTLLQAVAAGDWHFATIHLTIAGEAQAQSILCDTYTYVNDVLGTPAQHTLGFATPSQAVLTPSFDTGSITVQVLVAGG